MGTMTDSSHSSGSSSLFQIAIISLWIAPRIVLPPALISSAGIKTVLLQQIRPIRLPSFPFGWCHSVILGNISHLFQRDSKTRFARIQNATLWRVRVMFIPPPQFYSLDSEVLWRFTVAGGISTYFGLQVKCQILTKFGFSLTDFHKRPRQ